MTAVRPVSPNSLAANVTRRSTHGFSSNPETRRGTPRSRFSRPQVCGSRRWADLAGRSIALSDAVPTIFDEPLAPHHRLVGRWVASRETSARRYTRAQARRRIEQVFNDAVMQILDPVDLADLRIVVVHSEEDDPPGAAIICDSMGQLDLGWIETGDAPIPWRAAAYSALEQTLGLALPIADYDDLFENMAMYYWDGELDDEAARQSLIEYQGVNADDLDEYTLPSAMNARRPEWMIAASAARPRQLPKALGQALRKLRETHGALSNVPSDFNAWHFDAQIVDEYLPGFEECSTVPPLTLVPVAQFARELDDVGRSGMEMGFMDIAGICPLPDANRIDDWLASLSLGAKLLRAAQDLIQLDPTKL